MFLRPGVSRGGVCGFCLRSQGRCGDRIAHPVQEGLDHADPITLVPGLAARRQLPGVLR